MNIFQGLLRGLWIPVFCMSVPATQWILLYILRYKHESFLIKKRHDSLASVEENNINVGTSSGNIENPMQNFERITIYDNL
jgi:hypothetical protein